jgi:hypothetical protein
VKRTSWQGTGAALLALAALACVPLAARSPDAPLPLTTRASDIPAWSEPTDVAAFRARYAERAGVRQRCEDGRPFDTAYDELERAGWAALLALTESWLERCPIDIDFHRLRAKALFEADRAPEAKNHMRWFRGLVAAVQASGDGAQPESAYVVLSVPEEHAMLRALELAPLRQIWVPDGVHAFEVRNEAGEIRMIYFNPSARMSRLLQETPLENESPAPPPAR